MAPVSPTPHGISAPLAIVSALHDELRALLPLVEAARVVEHAGRRFHLGTLHGRPAVLVLSGIGKVAAALTAALLVERFGVAELLFTGVAGGLHPDVAVGDVVVATELLQHDMDASPLFPRYEIPLTGRARFAVDAGRCAALADAARHAVPGARVHCGLVISGDVFVHRPAHGAALRDALPDALAVEMEGAALAQACCDMGVPYAVLRAISDRADAAAPTDFTRFVAEVASVYTRDIVGRWLNAGDATGVEGAAR